MRSIVSVLVCVAALTLAASSHAQYPYRVATIGPYAPGPGGWIYRGPVTSYDPYTVPWLGAYPWAYGGYGPYAPPLYDPAAREIRRLRYAVEDAVYAPLPPLRPAFKPGPRPSGFDLPSRRAGR